MEEREYVYPLLKKFLRNNSNTDKLLHQDISLFTIVKVIEDIYVYMYGCGLVYKSVYKIIFTYEHNSIILTRDYNRYERKPKNKISNIDAKIINYIINKIYIKSKEDNDFLLGLRYYTNTTLENILITDNEEMFIRQKNFSIEISPKEIIKKHNIENRLKDLDEHNMVSLYKIYRYADEYIDKLFKK